MPVPNNRLSGEGLKKQINDYLGSHCLIERNLTSKTIQGKRQTLARLTLYLDEAPLNLESCRNYGKHLFKRKWRPVSIRSELKVVKAFVRFLFDREYIPENWSSKIVLPKVRRKQLQIIPAELAEKVIFAGTNPAGTNHRLCRLEHREALRFILRTGLRLSELLRLKPGDINFENRTFIVQSKGGNIDVLPLPVDMIKRLEKRKANKKLFKVTAETLNRCLRRGRQGLKVHSKVTVHSLRHIFCTELLKNGVSLQIVSRLMRHSSVGITDSVYSHYLIEDLSLALNFHHTLIVRKLGHREIFDRIQEYSEAVCDKSNLKIRCRKTEKALVVKIAAY